MNIFFYRITNNSDVPKELRKLKGTPDQVRSKIIDANFESKIPFVYVLKDTSTVTKSKVSNWQIFKLSIEDIINDKRARWKTVASIVGVIGAATFLVGLSYLSYMLLAKSYFDIGKFFNITTYQDGVPIFTRYHVQWTKYDFLGECLNFVMGYLFIAAIPCIKIYEWMLQNPFAIKFKQNKQIYQNSYWQNKKLRRINSSMANFKLDELSNERENKLIIDPMTSSEIQEEQIRNPKIIRIEKCAYTINSVLRTLFGRTNLTSAGKIPHPFLQSYLEEEAQEKFLNDIAALFCIDDKEKLLNCWNTSSEKDRKNEFLKLIPYDSRKHLLEL